MLDWLNQQEEQLKVVMGQLIQKKMEIIRQLDDMENGLNNLHALKEMYKIKKGGEKD